MPELPEVRAHAERLGAAFSGAVLEAFSPLSFTVLKTVMPPPEAAAGQHLAEVRSRGKYLILDFATATFVVHLMQGGRLREDAGTSRRAPSSKGGRVARWRFADGRALALSEAGSERRAGVWVVPPRPEDQPPLVDLGPEADAVTDDELGERLRERPGRLHTVLRDQHVIAGIGRRLANEICHRSGLSPFAATARLGDEEVAAVARALRELVAEGLEAEGARKDMSASADRPAAVHNRVGEACPVCSDIVRSVEYRDYTICYCPSCQTSGRVLSDNAYSRLGISDPPPRPRGRR